MPAGDPEGIGAWRTIGRHVPRAGLPPELCLVSVAAVILMAGVVMTGQAEPAEGRSRVELGLHTSPIEGLAFAPDGRSAASASRDGTVMVWDVATCRHRRVIARDRAGFTSVAFSPDGRAVLTGGLTGAVSLSDLGTGEVLTAFSGHTMGVRSVAFAPDGRSVASGGDDCTVRVWDVESGRQRLALRGHGGFVQALAFAPDARSLASVALDGEAILWDLGSGRARERFRAAPGPLSSLAFAPGGGSLAVGGNGRITLREISSGRSRSWPCDQGRVTSLLFLSEGATLASSGLDGSVALWKVSPGEVLPRSTLRGHSGGVKTLAASPDGTTLISGGNDDAVRLWDLTGGSPDA
jgi:WD40 repeat protein